MNKQLLSLVMPEPTEQEIREACRAKREELGFNIEEALFPINPLLIPENERLPIDEAIALFQEFKLVRASIRGSVWGSVMDLVWGSVWDSIRGSVWDSVRLSVLGSVGGSVGGLVWDLVFAYISSLFPSDHQEGENPFQCGVDLWRGGYVAGFDGEVWRLHAGENAEVVYEEKVGD